VLLEISVAGYASHWAYRGSKAFSTWAETKPWLREGGLCVVRIESAEVSDLMIPSVRRAVHGSNGAESRLDIRRVEVGGPAGSPSQALLHEFELDPTISPFEARDKIRKCLLDKSFLLVFVEAAPVDPTDWEETVSLLEYYRKSTNPVRLSAIVVDGRGAVRSEPVFDFLYGRPTHHVLSDVSSTMDEGSLWPAYLHHRAAWEAGGFLSYAMSVGSELERIATCDDEAVELALQTHANVRLAAHAGRQMLCDFVGLGAGGVRPDQARLRSLQAELFAVNLLWRPPSMNSLHVVPWAARALLAMPSLPKKQIWALRHHLVCAPLAGEILSLCLQFESQIQTNLHGRQDRSKISNSTISGQDRFKSGLDDFVVYPSAFPASPSSQDDVWAFASLGENLKSCPSNAVPNLYWQTLWLRNAIAHGHYVGWPHVRMALRMLRYFDTSL
jgi:hypothetical protein